ncbi:hypothetical protein [Vibrio europaeus]|uniref:hypothetical protein n=1 Tax=Vibrio europaeus TaxID=300876 RepID=UPI00233EA6E8|nr:hypothetical protein [Vibrio europaeus]MDC5753574.1 hypothetical protein [Vibrio europaeus]MDC5816513.1 hypothetical protein [Vibrio europaeus]
MAKTDWNSHCETFLKQDDQSAKARNAYAGANGINPNSFRRELSNYKKLTASSDTSKANGKPDQNKKSDQNAKADQEKSQKPSKNKTLKNQKDKSKGKAGGSDHTKPDQSGGTTRGRAHVAKNDPNVIRENGTRRFKKGNTASLIHGAYAKEFFLHDGHEEWATTPLADIHSLAKSKYMLMESIRTDLIRQTKNDYEEGRSHTKEVFEGGELTLVPMTFQEAIFAAMLAGHKEQTKLLSDIAKVEQTQNSLNIQSYNLSPLSKEEQIKEIASVLASYEKKEITAIDAGLALSAKGIEPPGTLKLLIEKEVEAMDDNDDSEEGITEEELARLKAESAEFANTEDEKVSDNRAMLAQLMQEEANG